MNLFFLLLIVKRETPPVNSAACFGRDSQRPPAYKTNQRQGFIPCKEKLSVFTRMDERSLFLEYETAYG